MKLLLGATLLCIVIGLVSPRIGRREYAAIVLAMVTMAFLYYRFGERFM
jgi:hypothetical protein